MLGTLDFEAPVNIGQIYLAVRIGEMRFNPLDTCILVLALSAALLAALNLWRMGHCEDREKRLISALHRAPLPRAEPARGPPRRGWHHRGAVARVRPEDQPVRHDAAGRR